MIDVLLWAFDYFYHLDKANACVHCATVKFSPITFRLAEQLVDSWTVGTDWTEALAEVLAHQGAYEEDPGR